MYNILLLTVYTNCQPEYVDIKKFIAVGLVLLLVYSVICGIISSYINQKKGYVGGFEWGFFLGIIGVIIVACKSISYYGTFSITSSEPPESKYKKLKKGDWKCNKCGNINQSYITSCNCGMSMWDNEKYVPDGKWINGKWVSDEKSEKETDI